MLVQIGKRSEREITKEDAYLYRLNTCKFCSLEPRCEKDFENLSRCIEEEDEEVLEEIKSNLESIGNYQRSIGYKHGKSLRKVLKKALRSLVPPGGARVKGGWVKDLLNVKLASYATGATKENRKRASFSCSGAAEFFPAEEEPDEDYYIID